MGLWAEMKRPAQRAANMTANRRHGLIRGLIKGHAPSLCGYKGAAVPHRVPQKKSLKSVSVQAIVNRKARPAFRGRPQGTDRTVGRRRQEPKKHNISGIISCCACNRAAFVLCKHAA
jgi:hypothetical protein